MCLDLCIRFKTLFILHRHDEVCDSQGVPGYGKVTELARALVDMGDALQTASLTDDDFTSVGHLWQQLDQFDKQPTHFENVGRGNVRRKQTSGGNATLPKYNRYVEAMCMLLQRKALRGQIKDSTAYILVCIFCCVNI